MKSLTFLIDNIHGLCMADSQPWVFHKGETCMVESLSEPYNTVNGTYYQVQVVTAVGSVYTVVENGEVELC